jgi:hypothetical protein
LPARTATPQTHLLAETNIKCRHRQNPLAQAGYSLSRIEYRRFRRGFLSPILRAAEILKQRREGRVDCLRKNRVRKND